MANCKGCIATLPLKEFTRLYLMGYKMRGATFDIFDKFRDTEGRWKIC
jgi:hypothetical protein